MILTMKIIALTFLVFLLKSEALIPRASRKSIGSLVSPLNKLKRSHFNGKITAVSDSSIWEIDADTSEIECESSADIQRKLAAAAEKARIEAELALKKKQEEEERLRLELLAQEEEKARKSATEQLPIPSDTSKAVQAIKSNEVQPSPKKTGLFDVGLIVLFPIMIGTLLLFLFFPIIGQQLAGSLPPPAP